MGVTVAQLDAITKILYDGGYERHVFEDNIFLAMLKKDEDFRGKRKEISLLYGDPQGRSANFAKAYARRSDPIEGVVWQLPRKKDYAVVSLDTETVLAVEGEEAAFVNSVKGHTDGALNTLKQSMGLSAMRSGTGRRGRIKNTTNVATAVLILETKEDVNNFEKNMVLEVSATDGGGAGVRAGTIKVLKVDRENGQLTMTGNLNAGIAAIANTDYIFAEGDYDSMFFGLDGWIPKVAPVGGDSWCGVDRSSDTVRLAGVRYDASAVNHEDALIQGQAEVGIHGGKPKVCLMNPTDKTQLVQILGNRIQRRQLEAAGIGFSSIVVEGDYGEMDVVSDRRIERGYAFPLTIETWEFHSLGKFPRNLKLHGGEFQQEDSNDAHQWRIGGFGNIVNRAPGHNGRVKLNTAA